MYSQGHVKCKHALFQLAIDNLPPPNVSYDNDMKTVVEYHTNEDGKVVKVRGVVSMK